MRYLAKTEDGRLEAKLFLKKRPQENPTVVVDSNAKTTTVCFTEKPVYKGGLCVDDGYVEVQYAYSDLITGMIVRVNYRPCWERLTVISERLAKYFGHFCADALISELERYQLINDYVITMKKVSLAYEVMTML